MSTPLAAFGPGILIITGFLKQTLGGVFDNCRISKVSHRDPGDMDGDGMIIIEIEVIGP